MVSERFPSSPCRRDTSYVSFSTFVKSLHPSPPQWRPERSVKSTVRQERDSLWRLPGMGVCKPPGPRTTCPTEDKTTSGTGLATYTTTSLLVGVTCNRGRGVCGGLSVVSCPVVNRTGEDSPLPPSQRVTNPRSRDHSKIRPKLRTLYNPVN